MAKIRIAFSSPQTFGEVTVTELTVEGDRLMVLAEGEVVADVLADAVERVDHGPPGSRLAEVRQRHPNHGKAWSDADLELLGQLYQDGAKIPDLMERFGRSRSGIRSRLVSLGLIDPPAGQEASSEQE